MSDYKITYNDGKTDIANADHIKYHSSMGLIILEGADDRIVAVLRYEEIKSVIKLPDTKGGK